MVFDSTIIAAVLSATILGLCNIIANSIARSRSSDSSSSPQGNGFSSEKIHDQVTAATVFSVMGLWFFARFFDEAVGQYAAWIRSMFFIVASGVILSSLTYLYFSVSIDLGTIVARGVSLEVAALVLTFFPLPVPEGFYSTNIGINFVMFIAAETIIFWLISLFRRFFNYLGS